MTINIFQLVYSNYSYFDDKKSGVPLLQALVLFVWVNCIEILEKFLSEMFQNICFSFLPFQRYA